ncbi:hypothetical protein Q5752_001810 [Cryptotrichosporon argae]
MAGIQAVPNEVWQAHLLPYLPLPDLFSLGATSRHFYALTLDPQLWLRKTRLTFSYAPSVASPSAEWYRRVYLGLLHPRTFVWGSANNARLTSLADQPRPGVVRRVAAVDRPLEITAQFGRARDWATALGDALRRDFPHRGHAGIVDLQAGGWGFTARDVDGGVWVWGQLDGQVLRFRAPSWEDRHCQCPDPTKIPLPCRAEAISAGRRHLLVLDADNLIWELTAWGLAFHHTSSALTAPTQSGAAGTTPHVTQLSAGWEHSAVLTADSAVHVWFPFSAEYVAARTPEADLHGPLGAVTSEDGGEDDVSRALRWGTVGGGIVHHLDAVPRRPGPVEGEEALEQQWADLPRWRDDEDEKVVKIASGLGWVVALKARGEVWAAKVRPDSIGAWTYLPHFSSPTTTHISAQYETLATYSPTSAHSLRFTRVPANFPEAGTWRPSHVPELEGKRVLQYVAGDYHSAALTTDGVLYTWGQNAHGQLGLGAAATGVRLGSVQDRPTKVEFADEDAFVFAVTAAGWHTGALVLGDPRERAKDAVAVPVEQAQGDTDEEPHAPMPGAFPGPTPLTGTGMGMGAGLGGGMRGGMFRIGFAGRGVARGAGRGAAAGGRGASSSSGLRMLPLPRPQE